MQAKESLVGRLVGPDRLHVVHDVVFDMYLQARDLGQVVVVVAKRFE